jgi:glycosyltransferase involved in cell wall biosynthesis
MGESAVLARSTGPESGESRDIRRLLVISYHFDGEVSVGGLRWSGLTRALAARDWRVAVLTGPPAPGAGPWAPVRVDACSRLPTVIDGLRFARRRLPRAAPGRSPAASRTHPGRLRPLAVLARELGACLTFPDESRGWMLRATVRARSMIRQFRPDVVLSSGPPHSAHVVAWAAARGTGIRRLVDLRDPWAGPFKRAWDAHSIFGSRSFRILSAGLERLVLLRADGLITNTPGLARALAARYSGLGITCIPNGVDPESLPPATRERYPPLSVAYAGTLYGGRDLQPVLRALRSFLDRHPEAACAGTRLRVAGEITTEHARALDDAARATGMTRHLEMLGPLSRPRALDLVSRSHAAVVLSQGQQLQVPAKLYESLGMGVRTLVVAEPGSSAWLEGIRVGAAVHDPRDIEGLAAEFEAIWRDSDRARSPCPEAITYQAIARQIEPLLAGGGTGA